MDHIYNTRFSEGFSCIVFESIDTYLQINSISRKSKLVIVYILSVLVMKGETMSFPNISGCRLGAFLGFWELLPWGHYNLLGG